MSTLNKNHKFINITNTRRISVKTIQINHTLVLQGMAISTYLNGESVLQKAITGMFTYDASVIGCLSSAGSVTTSNLGSRKAAYDK